MGVLPASDPKTVSGDGFHLNIRGALKFDETIPEVNVHLLHMIWAATNVASWKDASFTRAALVRIVQEDEELYRKHSGNPIQFIKQLYAGTHKVNGKTIDAFISRYCDECRGTRGAPALQ